MSSAPYCQTPPKKNQIAAVAHTGEILTRCSQTIATHSYLHVETACHWFSQNWVGGRVAIALVHLRGARKFQCAVCWFWICKSQLLQKHFKIRSLSAFAFETITLRNFKKKKYEANASVKRDIVNTTKQLMSSKLAMKMLGERWSSKGVVLLVQTVWYVNSWNYSKKLTYSVSFWVGLHGAKSSGH